MNYPEAMCAPMRADLTSAGFVELKTPEAVSDLLDKNNPKYFLVCSLLLKVLRSYLIPQ